jgi:hypothetical protein
MPGHEHEPAAEPAPRTERAPGGPAAIRVEGPLTPALLRRVQQTAGNQAAGRLLARQGTASDPALAGGGPGLLDLVGLGADRNPSLTSEHKNASFKALEGGVLGTPDPGDVVQGDLGDCYFLASLAAVAHAKPSLITAMFTDKGGGTYEVRLYKDTAWVGTTLEARTVTVTATFPNEDGNWIYAKPSGSEFWVMLAEKALAKFKGDYSDAEGGYANEALQMITGNKATEYDVDDYPEYALASIFGNLTSDGWAIVVGSNHPWTSAGKKKAKASGVITYHEYTVVKYDSSAKTLDLRNPWGSESITGMSLGTFKENFRRFWGVPTK